MSLEEIISRTIYESEQKEGEQEEEEVIPEGGDSEEELEEEEVESGGDEGESGDDDEGDESDDAGDGDDSDEGSKKGDGDENIPYRKVLVRLPSGEERREDPGSIYRIKVDGKWQNIPLHEVVSRASASLHSEEVVREAEDLKREAEVEFEQIKTQGDNLRRAEQAITASLMPEEGKTWTKLSNLIGAAQLNPAAVEKMLYKELVPKWFGDLEQLGGFDEKIVDKYFSDKESQYENRILKSRLQKVSEAENLTKREAQELKDLSERNGLTEKETAEVRTWLEGPGGKKWLRDQGVKEITPGVIVNLAVGAKHAARAEQVILSHNPKAKELLGSGYGEHVQYITKVINRDPDIEDDELIEDFVSRRLKDVSEAKVQKRLKKKAKVSKSSPASKKPKAVRSYWREGNL